MQGGQGRVTKMCHRPDACRTRGSEFGDNHHRRNACLRHSSGATLSCKKMIGCWAAINITLHMRLLRWQGDPRIDSVGCTELQVELHPNTTPRDDT